jgi:hypothetical protein
VVRLLVLALPLPVLLLPLLRLLCLLLLLSLVALRAPLLVHGAALGAGTTVGDSSTFEWEAHFHFDDDARYLTS